MEPKPTAQPLPGMPEPYPKCQRCGRMLKREPGRTIGYGPRCAQIAGIDAAQLKAEIDAEVAAGLPHRLDTDRYDPDTLTTRMRSLGFTVDFIRLADGRYGIKITGRGYDALTTSDQPDVMRIAYTKWSVWFHKEFDT